jgi:hypothetical protein
LDRNLEREWRKRKIELDDFGKEETMKSYFLLKKIIKRWKHNWLDK